MILNTKNAYNCKIWTSILAMLILIPTFAVKPNDTITPKQLQTAAQVDVKLSLLSNKKLDVTFRIPSQQAYGFSGDAQTPEHKSTVDSVVDNMKQNITKIIAVDPDLDCKYDVSNIDPFSQEKERHEKTTSTATNKIKTEYNVLKVDVTLDCAKDLLSKKLSIDFSKDFKNIDKILVNLKSKQKRKFAIDSSSGSFSL